MGAWADMERMLSSCWRRLLRRVMKLVVMLLYHKYQEGERFCGVALAMLDAKRWVAF